MSDINPKTSKNQESEDSVPSPEEIATNQGPPRKGPASFFSGSLTSILFAWISLILSRKVVEYFMIHPQHYSSPIAQSAASGFKTLVIGTCFLSTFTFAFIGLGLLVVFVRSLFSANYPLSD